MTFIPYPNQCQQAMMAFGNQACKCWNLGSWRYRQGANSFPYNITKLSSRKGTSFYISTNKMQGNCFYPWWLGRFRICLQCRRPRFDAWVRKIPWRKEWLPTPVFLPGETHGQRSLVGYSPWGRKESDTTGWLTHTFSMYYQISKSNLIGFLKKFYLKIFFKVLKF